MNSWVCADAGLAIKRVFLDEPDAPLARALWAEWKEQKLTVIAPTLWAYEVTSVVRKQVYRRQMAPDAEPATLTAVLHLPVQLMRPPNLHARVRVGAASESAGCLRCPLPGAG